MPQPENLSDPRNVLLSNRRRYDRLAVDLPGFFRIENAGPGAEYQATIINFTPMGLCFSSSQEIAQGTRGQMKMRYENGEESRFTFEVVWANQFDNENKYRVGVRILMEESPADHPQVIARPPQIYLLFILAGIFAQQYWPMVFPFGFDGALPGRVLLVLGAMLLLTGVAQMRRAGTPVNPRQTTQKLLMTGVFRFSRNPLYVSLTMIYLGIATVVSNVWLIVLVVPLLGLMHFGVIRREEEYLTQKFGVEYSDYQRRVRRWF